MLKRILSGFIALIVVFGSSSSFAFAKKSQEKEPERIIPVSTGFSTEYYDEYGNKRDIALLCQNSDTSSLNLPESFDLRDQNRVTSVKNQLSEGYCWAFASTASIESSILSQPEILADKGEDFYLDLDLSEIGTALYAFTGVNDESSPFYGDYVNDPYKGSNGGVPEVIAYGLASGFGTFTEELIPYDQLHKGISDELRFYSDFGFKEYIKVLYGDIEFIKERIMDYGAVTCSYSNYRKNYYTNEEGMQSYCDFCEGVGGSTDASSHVVTIVGWDDNFSKDNFHPQARPKNNGAWLCKNSWGAENCSKADGYEGYIWISYESDSLEITQFTAQDADEFDKIYQHQYSAGFYEKVNSAANIFTSEDDEYLEQIVFSSLGEGEIKVSVYKLRENYTSPTDGDKLSEFNISVVGDILKAYDCPDEIFIEKGSTFSIVLENSGAYLNFRSDELSGETLTGKSFVKNTAQENWKDVANIDDSFMSYCVIKAYTTKVSKDYSQLESLLSVCKNLTVDKYAQQEDIELFNYWVSKAEEIVADKNSTQNQIDNTYCLLNNYYVKVSKAHFAINSIEDFEDYYISVISQNKKVSDIVVLNTDLDLKDFGILQPMHKQTLPFQGIFEGNGHTIKNVEILSTTYESTGFFGALGDSAQVLNLNFENVKVNGIGETGVICGSSSGALISNCNVKNSTVYSEYTCAGILTGQTYNSEITHCFVSESSVLCGSYSGVFYGMDKDGSIFSSCTSKDCTVVGYAGVRNEEFFLDTSSKYAVFKPIITLKSDSCTIESFVGKILDVSSKNAEIVLKDDIYNVAATEDEAFVVIEYPEPENSSFSISGDFINRKVLVTDYYGSDTDVVFPKTQYGVDVDGISPYFNCYFAENFTSITIPGNYKVVPDNVLSYTPNLQALNILEGIEYIGKNNFSSLEKITDIILPDSLKTIGDGAFSYCFNLGNIRFGSNLEVIGKGAFANCRNLKNITLPDSVKEVREDAFSGCSSLSIVFGKNIEIIEKNSVGYTDNMLNENEFVKIPNFVINGYKTTAVYQYAVENGFEFVDVSIEKPIVPEGSFSYNVFLRGDTDLDGKVTVKDATLIQKYISGMTELNDVSRFNAYVRELYDVINIKNATYIRKYIANIIDAI